MATIREYFDTDAQKLTTHAEWKMDSIDGSIYFKLIAKIAYNFEANARYWYFFIPSDIELSLSLGALFNTPELGSCQLQPEGDGVHVEMRHSDYSESPSTTTLQFTRRIHLYLDFDLSVENRASLVSEALKIGYYLSIRDREYARIRSASEKPLAFVSHDFRDKDVFVRDLVNELARNSCTVWYDEFTLKVGDSLRENIERGLKESKKCIVILSHNFFENEGWGKAEFDSIFTREIIEKQNIMLPIWLNVGVKDVYDYSPRLADKVGLPSSLGVLEIVRRLKIALKSAP